MNVILDLKNKFFTFLCVKLSQNKPLKRLQDHLIFLSANINLLVLLKVSWDNNNNNKIKISNLKLYPKLS